MTTMKTVRRLLVLLLLTTLGALEVTAQTKTCPEQWTSSADTHVYGGTGDPAMTLADCQAACFNSATCTGIDWDLNTQSPSKCWLTGNGVSGAAPSVTHYSLNRNTACPGAECSPMWAEYPNTNTYNGVATADTNVSSCKQTCINNVTCTGIDWNPLNPVGQQCWLSGPWNTGRNNGTAANITHHDLTRNANCGVCSPTWTLFQSTKVYGGMQNAADNIDTCKAVCLSSATCTGIDWDPNNPQNNKCWLSGNGVWVNGSATGVDHYLVNRNPNCNAACSPTWIQFQNTNVLGGSPNAATDIEPCKAACLMSSTCTGIDWDPNNPQTNKCWLSGNGAWNNWTATGVVHYLVNRNTNCSSGQGSTAVTIAPTGAPPTGAPAGTCTATYTTSENTNTLGGVPTSDTSETACKQACTNNASCTGVDWNSGNPAGQQCWLSGPWNTGRNNGTATGIRHYDIQTRTCGGQCVPTYMESPNTNALGGVPTADSTVAACQQTCANNATCTGFDWNPNSASGQKCWLSGPWNTARNNGTAFGITHYDIVRNKCQACNPDWIKSDNTNALGGMSTSDTSDVACKQSCLNNGSCMGIDWNSGNPAGQQCWLAGPWSTGRNNGTAIGITHYDLVRNANCSSVQGGQMTTAVASAVTSQLSCTLTWTLYENTNTLGGVSTSDTSETGCQQACSNNASCTGIDWNFSNPAGQQCWLSGPWNTGRNNGMATGIKHYDIARNCQGGALATATPCLYTWTTFNNTHTFNGQVVADANTESECKSACIKLKACTGLDLNPSQPNGLKCWLSGSWSTGSKDPATGITNFDITRTGVGC